MRRDRGGVIPLALAACALLAVVGVLAARKPVPRRLAVRFARRRPLEALLVVAGCLLGTAVLTAALCVGDVLEASLRQRAADRLGPVDVAVRSAAPVVADAVDTALTFDPRTASSP